MRAYIILVSVVLFATPLAALADRTWDLEGRGTIQVGGLGSERFNATGTLTLFGDVGDPVENRSYSLTIQIEGELPEVSTGVWLQERNRIQIFQESPAPSEAIADLEDLLSGLLETSVTLTSFEERLRINLNSRSQELRINSRGSLTARPGLRGNQPLKLRENLRLTGRPVSP
jgi:hypothetical protein